MAAVHSKVVASSSARPPKFGLLFSDGRQGLWCASLSELSMPTYSVQGRYLVWCSFGRGCCSLGRWAANSAFTLLIGGGGGLFLVVWASEDATSGELGVCGALAVTIPRSSYGGFAWWRHVFPRVGQVRESSRCGEVEGHRAIALCFGTSDSEACELPLAKPGLRVKTLDRFLGLNCGDTMCRLPLEGVVMEPRFLWGAALS